MFATETLAIGVNMPARSVVFTQLDKPKDMNAGGHRWLRPDEFWQMAGRAGRRGMDVKGYVVYAPTLSVAGLKNQVDMASLRSMMTGAMPAATSQLVVNTPFVLRHLARGHGPEVMQQTLLADQLKRDREFMQSQLEAQVAASGGGANAEGGDDIVQLAAEFSALDAKLKGTSSDGLGMFLKLDKKQEKKMMERKAQILAACGGDESLLTAQAKARETAVSLQKVIDDNGNEMSIQWDSAIAWLSGKGFVVRDASESSGYKLLPRGQACAAFSEGHPLVIGTVIADGYLEGMTFAEICAWLCLFLKKGRMREAQDLQLPTPSEALKKAWDRSDFLMDEVIKVHVLLVVHGYGCAYFGSLIATTSICSIHPFIDNHANACHLPFCVVVVCVHLAANGGDAHRLQRRQCLHGAPVHRLLRSRRRTSAVGECAHLSARANSGSLRSATWLTGTREGYIGWGTWEESGACV